jgi:hypothetical protein
MTIPKLPPPRAPARKTAAKAVPTARDIRSQAPTLPDDGMTRLPGEAPRRIRKGSARRIDPPPPPKALPVEDEEETTVRKHDPERKPRPRR